MSDFIVEKLTKSVGDKTVFKEISFIIHDLDRIGIIGVNGTGKTTLLDVVSERIGFDGDVSPFTKANGYKIAYLTQEPEFDDSKTCLLYTSCFLSRPLRSKRTTPSTLAKSVSSPPRPTFTPG